MEGSPVRGQHRAPIVQLNQTRDLQSFQSEVAHLLGAEVQHAEIFVGLVDPFSKELQLPSWVRAHLDNHAGLYKKLELGDLVGVSHIEDDPLPRPAAALRASVVLIPVLNDTVLYGAIGLVSPLDGPHVSSEDIETVRQYAHDAAPIVARLTELEQFRRQNRELLQKRNAVEAASQMRLHLQSNVAHELRTPLAAVRGYARMILDGRTGEITETQREYLSTVTENTNRLISLVSWMSHIVNLSEHQFNLSTFDLRDVWTDCVKANVPILDEKSVTLKERIPSDSFVIMGDREKLAYVFNQLIATAVQFTGKRTQITAEFSHGRNGEVTVKITEDSGIPAETLSKILDRSLNAIPVSMLSQASISGVSLSGVYDVVGLHGGRMFVNSTADKGSAFLFTLPAVQLDGEEKLA